jgi:hypothetical protein
VHVGIIGFIAEELAGGFEASVFFFLCEALDV